MNALSLGILCLVVNTIGQVAPAPSMGDRTVSAYRTLLRKPTPGGRLKADWIRDEVFHYVTTGTADRPFVIPPEAVPGYVARRAFGLELGIEPSHSEAEVKALARYPASVRRRWSPEAQRLWLEASYNPATSDPSTVRAEIAILRRKGQNLDALEAATVERELLQRIKGKPNVDDEFDKVAANLIRFSESHPRDFVAVKHAVNILSITTQIALRKGQPPHRDLLNRAFALEPRTLRNYNALTNDHVTRSKMFDELRRVVREGRPKG